MKKLNFVSSNLKTRPEIIYDIDYLTECVICGKYHKGRHTNLKPIILLLNLKAPFKHQINAF